MTTQVRNTLIIIAIAILLLITKGWWIPKVIVGLGGYVNQKTKVITKIEYKEGTIDTIAVFNEWVESNGIVINPEPVIEYVTIANPNVGQPDIIEGTKLYTVNVNDSLVEGIFKVLNNFEGDLLNTTFKYKPKFPKFIKQVDTIYRTDFITRTLDNDRNLIGVGVGYNNLDYPSVLASFTTKNKWQFVGEYGKPTTDIRGIINGSPFKLKREDLFSFKIIKHF